MVHLRKLWKLLQRDDLVRPRVRSRRDDILLLAAPGALGRCCQHRQKPGEAARQGLHLTGRAGFAHDGIAIPDHFEGDAG